MGMVAVFGVASWHRGEAVLSPERQAGGFEVCQHVEKPFRVGNNRIARRGELRRRGVVDEEPDRLEAVARMTWAWLRSVFDGSDDAWPVASKALEEKAASLGHGEAK